MAEPGSHRSTSADDIAVPCPHGTLRSAGQCARAGWIPVDPGRPAAAAGLCLVTAALNSTLESDLDDHWPERDGLAATRAAKNTLFKKTARREDHPEETGRLDKESYRGISRNVCTALRLPSRGIGRGDVFSGTPDHNPAGPTF
jgi:hypothetical protein